MLFSVFWCVSFRGEEFPDNILQATANLKTVNLIPALGEFQYLLKYLVSVLLVEPTF